MRIGVKAEKVFYRGLPSLEDLKKYNNINFHFLKRSEKQRNREKERKGERGREREKKRKRERDSEKRVDREIKTR